MTARAYCAWMGRGAVLTILLAAPAAGRSLRSELHEFVANNTTPVALDVVEPISGVLSRIVSRGIDFPVTSTAPPFSFTLDLASGGFVRTSESLGPTFAERAATVGRGRFDLGVTYLYADLRDADGRSFARQLTFASRVDAGGQSFLGAFQGRSFSLRTHELQASATYGITDAWDVNLLVPVMQTTLDLAVTAGAGFPSPGGTLIGVANFRFQDRYDNDAFGVGDVQLRTKYRCFERPWLQLAALFNLRLPTGRAADFQGSGDTTFTPSLVATMPFGRDELHARVGVETNAADGERDRALYALGGVWQIVAPMAFTADVLGSSSFTDDHFTVRRAGAIVPDFLTVPNEFVRGVDARGLRAAVPRSDVVDLAVGVRALVGGGGTVHLGAVVPLTRDGLRAEVIPTAGIEMVF